MADYPPFMNAYGTIPKILNKVKEAKTPSRFTQDFLAETLGFPGGSAKAFLPMAKRLGLLSSDGTPTELYHQFRNPDHSKGAMARAIRSGFADLFERNEDAHKLDKKGLEGLVMQATGLDQGSSTLRSIVNSFEALKAFAEFDSIAERPARQKKEVKEREDSKPPEGIVPIQQSLGLSYSIYLNLPKTDDIAVFNAIFRSLRENLLR